MRSISPLGAEFRELVMADVMAEFHDGPHATPPPADAGPVYLGIRNLTSGGSLDLSSVRHIAVEDFPRWTKRVTPQPGDLVFTYEATLHRYALIPAGFEGCLGRRLALIRPRLDLVDPNYLHLMMLSPDWRQTIEDRVISGATVDRIPIVDFPQFPIRLPSLLTQRRIAGVLSAFDELIEINQRRIELLEDLARSLYREWFVHFRFPGHEDVEFVDSESGPIPEGWDYMSLAELVTTQYGFTASAAPDEVGPRFLRGMDINKRSYVDWSQVLYCEIDDAQLAKFRLEVGDVCVIRMADPGKVGIVETAVEAVFASYLVRLRSITPRLPPYLLFHFLDSAEYQGWIGGSSTGSTRKSASASVLTEPQVAVPTLEVASRFQGLAARLRGQLTGLVEHSACLAATRDLLLPRLVTGRLDISDVDLGVLTPVELE